MFKGREIMGAKSGDLELEEGIKGSMDLLHVSLLTETHYETKT